jgi:hypothetical protein
LLRGSRNQACLKGWWLGREFGRELGDDGGSSRSLSGRGEKGGVGFRKWKRWR